jgi:excisionase family DNA binding protein
MTEIPRWVSRREAAASLGVSLTALRALLRDGTLPHVKVGGQIRIPLAALTPGALLGEPAPVCADYVPDAEAPEPATRVRLAWLDATAGRRVS